MRVTLVSINYAPEKTGIAVYSTGLARHLAGRGHDVRAITGFAYYPEWRKAPDDKAVLYRTERDDALLLHRCYLFVPRNPKVVRRILHELSFTFTAALRYLFAPRADVTVIVSPPLALGLVIGLLARLKRSPTVFHVQDLQPDAAIELGLLKPGMLTRALYAIERRIYSIVSAVSTISNGMRERIVGKGVPESKVMLFPNWADSNRIRPTHTRTDLRAAWGLDDKFVVLYSGATGIKQGLDMLLDCAALMKDEPGVRFVIVGDGGERPRLERLARERELGNVIFQPLQPVEALNDLLATADVSVIPQKAGVKEIVLPSKLGNILASGRPIVVSAAEDSDLARAVFDGECGEVVQPGAAGQMVGAIRKLMASPQLRERYGRNGRRVVDTRMSESVTLDLFLGRLELLAERPVKAGDAGLAPVQVGARNDVGGT